MFLQKKVQKAAFTSDFFISIFSILMKDLKTRIILIAVAE